MEKSFDFGALLKNNEKKHKSRPTQFVSVAGGVQKRLQTNIKNRKSNRLTIFDSIRNLPRCESPAPVSEAQQKVEHRRQQLEKWKAEKEQKKKEQAAQKKKPFITGVARAPLKFVPPPPPPKPSTSGRVTRSQTKTASVKPKPKTSPVKPAPKGRNTQSFAPNNASFKPPEIKNLIKLPTLAPPTKTKNKKASVFTFEPVLPTAPTTAKQSRTRPVLTRQNATEIKPNSRSKPQIETRSTRGKITKKPSPKKQTKKPLQSSSSGSDLEPVKLNKIRTPATKSLQEVKQLTPKVLAMKSTSEEKSSDDSSIDKSKRKYLRKSQSTSQSGSDKFSSDIEPSSIEEPTVVTKPRKSLPRNFSPRPLIATSSSDRISSDVEFIEERSGSDIEPSSIEEPTVVTKSRKSLPRNFSPRPLIATLSSDRISSDVEFIEERSPVMKVTRKSLPVTPRNRIPKSESSSEEKLRSPKSPIPLNLTPEQIESAKISPCVTMSRGKDNARKEMKWKIDEGLLDDDVSDIDSIDHFRKQLSSEIKRMTEMCVTWEKISEQTVLPEAVQEAVLSAVGQCRLLMSQKLQQFGALVERCARPEPGAALVTPADLLGFWDMVFMQVENIDLRFKKLEELRQRNWIEEQPLAKKKADVAKPVAKKTAKPAGGASRIKEMIAAARRAKKEQALQPSPATLKPADGEKTFDAGFFSVRSPVRASAPATPSPTTPANKTNLLKAVLSSEAKKASRNSTPFAMLRASIMAKNAEYDGIAPLPQTPQINPVNLYATPGRSILKSTNINASKSGKKSIKVVLFDASDSDAQENSLILQSVKNSDMYESAIDEELKPKANKKDLEITQDKENSQSPEITTVRTRNQRKSLQNISNAEVSTEVKTPRRSSRKKKVEEEDTKKTPSRTSGKKKTKELDKSTDNVEVKSERSKRSTRRNKVTTIC